MESPLSEADVTPPPAGIPCDLFCENCGYNLRALLKERCPECGEAFDAARLLGSRIPWAHRDRLGRFRTYWRTVWMVMFNHRRFCEEMARPVNYADSQRFRWVTVLHVFVPLLVMTLVVYGVYSPRATPNTGYAWSMVPPGMTAGSSLFDRLYVEPWIMVLVYLCVLLWLVAITGVQTYFFHPGNVDPTAQDRAHALSYYACAPLSLTVLPLALLLGGGSVAQNAGNWVPIQTGCVFAVLLLGLFWARSVVLVSRIFPGEVARPWWLAICLPPLWLLLGAVVLVGVGGTVFALAVIITSLR